MAVSYLFQTCFRPTISCASTVSTGASTGSNYFRPVSDLRLAALVKEVAVSDLLRTYVRRTVCCAARELAVSELFQTTSNPVHSTDKGATEFVGPNSEENTTTQHCHKGVSAVQCEHTPPKATKTLQVGANTSSTPQQQPPKKRI